MNIPLNACILMILSLCLFSCERGNKHEKPNNTYEVKAQSLHKRLHFTGTIQPLKESTLTCPMDAVVEKVHFHYGQMVKKGDVIFILNSTQLQKQYNEILTEYLKAKDSYTIAIAKFTGTLSLWKDGLISKNNYLSEKSSLDTLRVSLMQATEKLEELLGKVDEGGFQDVSRLSLSDFTKIKETLRSNHHLIHLKASGDGVLLYPPKSEDKSNLIKIGQTVKADQVLALIGDLKGLSVDIEVPEVDISKIHPGMDALISGIAFTEHPLRGKLVSVSAEATNSNTGSLPFFTAVVQVPTLTKDEQLFVKVGMSANIELNVDSPHQLVIPIEAVQRERNGETFVILKSAKGDVRKRSITTGAAESDSVIVAAGLSAGDVVMYD